MRVIKPARSKLKKHLALFFLCLPLLTCAAAPSSPVVTAQIAAPTLDGTVSAGVFDSSGSCIRLLHVNVPNDKIPSALNGFLLTWDGKTDSGKIAPNGDYEIRGITVGDVQIEGAAWHFNDWSDSDSPESFPEKTLSITLLPGGDFLATQKFSSDVVRTLHYDSTGTFKSNETAPIPPTPPSLPTNPEFSEIGTIIDLAAGKDNSLWIITANDAASQLRQFSTDGEVLRELDPDANETFDKVSAAPDSDQIALISTTPEGERVRILAKTSSPTSDLSLWKTLLEKRIQPCTGFGLDATGNPIPKGPLPAKNILQISLLPNELFPDTKPSAKLALLNYTQGLWLSTADGLPLLSISEKSSSPRCTLVRNAEGETLVFALIGNAVAEYQLTGLKNLMHFTSDKVSWPPGPKLPADETNVPSTEPAPTQE